MMKYYDALLDAVADRSTQELLGALLLALFAALAVTGIYALFRRKASDPLILLCSLVIVANIVSMAMAASYLQYARRTRTRRFTQFASPSMIPPGPRGGALARKIFAGADADRDGRLTREEAARAADRFVRIVDAERRDTHHKDSIDEDTLRVAIYNRMQEPVEEGLPFPPVPRPALIPPPAGAPESSAGADRESSSQDEPRSRSRSGRERADDRPAEPDR